MFNSSPLGCLVVVDDDQNIADMLKLNLVDEGFSVEVHKVAEEVYGGILCKAFHIAHSKNRDY